MNTGKICSMDCKDELTGLRFVEDNRGVLHLVCPMADMENKEITINVVMPNVEECEKENRRLKRILESLRSENVWIYEAVETAFRERKTHSANYAMNRLQQKIDDRRR